MPVDFIPNSNNPKCLQILSSVLYGTAFLHLKTTGLPATKRATFSTAGCFCCLARGVDPAAATLAAAPDGLAERGAYLPKGASRDLCLPCSPHFPSLSPSSMPAFPACKFLPFTPFLAPGLSVSCSLHSWPALVEGQIFTALRLTEDRTGAQETGVSLQLTQTEG